MNYSIIGSGNVGMALAGKFARAGIPVGMANTRGPDSVRELVAQLGGSVTAKHLNDALNADVIILAVPFRAHAAIAELSEDWEGKIIIDAMNTYGVTPEELAGQASTDIVASSFVNARVVKTLNQLPARLLALDPAEDGGRRVMFVSGNDETATSTVAELVGLLGFSPIVLGKIAEGGALISIGGPLILQNLIKKG
ncbi:NADP oxidoreductase coenzyme [Stenotrophomonas indicatrix]|uniref:NADPH-dependent F420 reductase n=1 Tax=Stenotrophomonas indicatrix TaxID=2045451 RepID=UPI000C18952D|nr:NAD(P)-binding domain-containing protein [Stenotrophomonas indicatrix]PII15843.1 NADP oxidoreductase coenzyme [Stenotrophomonas indicatrix]